MLRKIVGFHQDHESHWVADLDCGHAQHTRHDPPFFPRPWVLTPAGRNAHVGLELDCVLCDRNTIPDGYIAYRQTPIFTATTLPTGLRQRHSTKTGIWGIIHVVTGTLRYRIYHPVHSEEILDQQRPGIILPKVEHDVQPADNTEFYVEFWRPDATRLEP